jgi:hypothetical protein
VVELVETAQERDFRSLPIAVVLKIEKRGGSRNLENEKTRYDGDA